MTGRERQPRDLEILVPDVLAGERVDKIVALLGGVSRRSAVELVEGGKVLVEGQPVMVRSRALSVGELLRVRVPPPDDETPVADASVQFTVVHEDESVVVVDKPAGLVVHAGAGNRSGTLVSGLLARYPELVDLPRSGAGETGRPGIVHRLDKGTSGLLVVARTVDSYRSLSRQFRAHSARREYLALVAGSLEADAGIVDAPIGRSARRPDRMAVTSRGRQAATAYEVVARYSEPVVATLLDVSLTTGRTHQVRVHLAAIGHPLIGDDRYGGAASRPAALKDAMTSGRVFLHAQRLEIDHPAGERTVWTAPLPADLAIALDRLTQS